MYTLRVNHKTEGWFGGIITSYKYIGLTLIQYTLPNDPETYALLLDDILDIIITDYVDNISNDPNNFQDGPTVSCVTLEI